MTLQPNQALPKAEGLEYLQDMSRKYRVASVQLMEDPEDLTYLQEYTYLN